ncbi:hypothetical protein EJD97_001498, partial [Solanum chilense]
MEVENECYDNEFLEKISILVVDDDTSSLLITYELLKKENFKVVTVKNANEALSTLQINENSFDLVIIAVRMPVMNGLQLQQQITNGFNIPVVLISDDKSECGIIQGFENGAVFLMVKPISQNDVHELWQYAIMQRKKKNRGKQGIVQENTNEEIVAENVTPPPKKTRLVWTEYLHNKFLEAITILGLKITAPIDTSRKLIPKSRIGNARKAIQLAATSTQQLMTENSNSVTAQNDELVAPFQRDPKDKMFADMLNYHLSREYREYRDRMNNFYSIMNSNMQITNAFNNVQSSTIMENNNIEEGTNLSFVDGNNQYQQAYFPWVDHTLDQASLSYIL